MNCKNLPSLGERLASRTKRVGECLIWTGEINNWGYGLMSYEGKTKSTHRWSYINKHGSIPAGLCVLHKCDTPACINTDHLFTGTLKDNMVDMVAKGRNRNTVGGANENAKLTEIDVLRIRSLAAGGMKHKDIAEQYPVVVQTVSNIICRLRWKHI